ncbi:MAG: GNAT family N-acetyltransferase [Ruminococcus sp.]|nr:GNAT family N-acetyltransferase [Ruminococcus sp.]
MSIEVTFGKLREEDLSEAFELCTRCFGEFVSFENVRETYQLCKNDMNYHFIVGRHNGKVVAYASMILSYNLFDGTYPVATLWYVCVHEDYRRQGVARALFREIDRIADENSVEVIMLTCDKDNLQAKKLYRTLGYAEDTETLFLKNIYEQWD